MDTTLLVALTSSVTAILTATLAATLSHVFARRRDFDAAERKRKIDCYSALHSALAAVGSGEPDHVRLFGVAANAMYLVAPQKVLSALVEAHRLGSVPIDSPEFKRLVISMRNDLGVGLDDDVGTFPLQLFTTTPRPVTVFAARDPSPVTRRPLVTASGNNGDTAPIRTPLPNDPIAARPALSSAPGTHRNSSE